MKFVWRVTCLGTVLVLCVSYILYFVYPPSHMKQIPLHEPPITCSSLTSPPREYGILHWTKHLLENAYTTLPTYFYDDDYDTRPVDLSYLPEKKTHVPLEVLVVPFSSIHVAKTQTSSKTYERVTSHVLRWMLHSLLKYKDMTFVWPEVHSFSIWWEALNSTEKKWVRDLVAIEKRLELAGGGWVTPDESLTSLTALLEIQTTGRWWLNQSNVSLPYSPVSWGVETRGSSALNPFYLSKFGYMGHVLNHVNFRLKEHLRNISLVEWEWITPWKVNHSQAGMYGDSLLTSLLPFVSYQIKHSCGPHSGICQDYDFRAVMGESAASGYTPLTEAVNAKNVQYMAQSLWKELRLKSRLYPHEILLFPLGDVERFDKESEWMQQYENYHRLFTYINEQPTWNMHIRFATLREYFQRLQKVHKIERSLPRLMGDFMPFAETRLKYWSGMFASRSQWKRRLHETEALLRSAEILTSLVVLHTLEVDGREWMANVTRSLQNLRREHAFLQHMDSPTGLMHESVLQEEHYPRITTLQQSIEQLLQSDLHQLIHYSGANDSKNEKPSFNLLDVTKPPTELPPFPVGRHSLTLFNPDTVARSECLTLLVMSKLVAVYRIHGDPVTKLEHRRESLRCQVGPSFRTTRGSGRVSTHIHEVLLCPGLLPAAHSIITLTLVVGESLHHNHLCAPVTHIYSTDAVLYRRRESASAPSDKSASIWSVESWHEGGAFSLGNTDLTVTFSTATATPIILHSHVQQTHLGLHNCDLRWISAKGGSTFRMNVKDILNKKHDEEDEEEKHIEATLYHVEGPLRSSVRVQHSNYNITFHIYNVPRLAYKLDILHEIQMGSTATMGSGELVFHCETTVKNQQGEFYTDANGFVLLPRRYMSTQPISGNVYPMGLVAALEDDRTRLSLVTDTPHGFTSVNTGQFQLWMYRLNHPQDGANSGDYIPQDAPVRMRMSVILEAISAKTSTTSSATHAFSPLVAFQTRSLTFPLLMWTDTEKPQPRFPFLPPLFEFPCNLEVVNMRLMEHTQEVLVVVMNRPLTCRTFPRADCPTQRRVISTKEIFTENSFGLIKRVRETSLDGLTTMKEISLKDDILLFDVADIKAFI